MALALLKGLVIIFGHCPQEPCGRISGHCDGKLRAIGSDINRVRVGSVTQHRAKKQDCNDQHSHGRHLEEKLAFQQTSAPLIRTREDY